MDYVRGAIDTAQMSENLPGIKGQDLPFFNMFKQAPSFLKRSKHMDPGGSIQSKYHMALPTVL